MTYNLEDLCFYSSSVQVDPLKADAPKPARAPSPKTLCDLKSWRHKTVEGACWCAAGRPKKNRAGLPKTPFRGSVQNTACCRKGNVVEVGDEEKRKQRFLKWRLIQGLINHYHKLWQAGMRDVWNGLNHRLLKWVKWEKGSYKYASLKWLKQQYKEDPGLFAHWKLVHP